MSSLLVIIIIIIICQHKILEMVLLCGIRSHCHLYPLFVMAAEHNLVLSTPLIFGFGVWLVTSIIKVMLLVTLLLGLVASYKGAHCE